MIRKEVNHGSHCGKTSSVFAFAATVQVTRVEQWCVEADSADEAHELLASGEGHRCDPGACLHAEVIKVEDC
jgi:hypothetical protein